ncbi:DNA fragmentation factor subunit beta [Pseudolycoriella hygida]|uniref:DNAation factor subunit beta n=1 Tax=Pseudolycoriella hygida TaxID=35572 RepID=A0A9Q0NGL1_9DIPT|nr:DNA fragmentation factor subunit beta [Pseudolycoriella hygida]
MQLSGYKITDVNRTKKYGVAANSLKMLKDKASVKLNITKPELYIAKDGTAVLDEDYFSTIAPQTLFIVATHKDKVQTDFELFYNAIRKNFSIIQTGNLIKNFVNENRDDVSKHLSECISKSENLKMKSARTDHIEWFEGQLVGLDTKEKVMCRRSQDRIRGYFYKAKDDLIRSEIYRTNKKARILIDNILDTFRKLLTGVDYFASYFDRSHQNRHDLVKKKDELDGEIPRKKLKQNIQNLLKKHEIFDQFCVSLCTEDGDFLCHGLWNTDKCQYDNHTINPYESRENAILFQIWNLDHRIEISRSILPSMLDTISDLVEGNLKCTQHKQNCVNISVLKYFLEIFTVHNLKFVHIVCHDKGVHELQSRGGGICPKCDEYKFIAKLCK